MKATISPKLLAAVFASSLLLPICVQAATPRNENNEATFTSIDLPDSTFTTAVGINARGEIVGRYVSAADRKTHGFLRSKNAEFTTIDFPGATVTQAYGINSACGPAPLLRSGPPALSSTCW